MLSLGKLYGQGGSALAMFRTKTLLILALMLFTLVTPVVAVYAEDEVTPVGTAKIQDDKSTNDSVVVSLSGIAPAPEDLTTSYRWNHMTGRCPLLWAR